MGKKHQEPRRAAIYTRISQDREYKRAGVKRQRKDCLALAKRLGYKVADEDVFTDDDKGASTRSRTKHRPQYEAMLVGARAGQYQAILAYSNSRLTRRPREFEDLIDLYEKHGVELHTVASGSFDLATADGRQQARNLANNATAEAERTGDRTKRAKDERVQKGLFLGGRTPYGWDYDKISHRLSVNEAEAERVRAATDEVLAGRSLAGLAKEWTEAGATTRTGKKWDAANLRDVLMRPRNAGLMSTGRATRGDLNVIAVKKKHRHNCPPLVDEDTWRALYSVLRDPARRTNAREPRRLLGPRRYVCGKCGGPMVPVSIKRVSTSKATRERVARGEPLRPEDYWPKEDAASLHYRCHDYAHLSIRADHTDGVVRAFLVDILRDPRIVALLTRTDPHLAANRERRNALAERLERVLTDYADGVLTRDQFLKANQRIQGQLDGVQATLNKAVTRSVSSPVLGAVDPGQAFLDAPIDVQRAVMDAVARVTILERVTRSTKWNSERVEIKLIAG